jgi:hypothetical protein
MVDILDFDMVTYFSIAMYYTSRVTHIPNLNLLGTRHFGKICGIWILDFDLIFNSEVHLEGNPYTKFEHFRLHVFLVKVHT